VIGYERLSRDFYLNNLLGNPVEAAIAAAHLIFGGVLDAFPQLHVGLPHGGGALPILIGKQDAVVCDQLVHNSVQAVLPTLAAAGTTCRPCQRPSSIISMPSLAMSMARKRRPQPPETVPVWSAPVQR